MNVIASLKRAFVGLASQNLFVMEEKTMNRLLLKNIKSIMVYIRNYPDDSELPQMIVALKDALQNNDNDIIVQKIKRNMPKVTDWIQEGSSSSEQYDDSVVEQFLCDCLNILLEAWEQENTRLVYDLSDMLQGIPDLEYWKSSKNMRDYWNVYVNPVKKEWDLTL